MKNKQLSILIVCSLFLILTGCSTIGKDYIELVEAGKDSIEVENFSEADRFFSKALNKNPEGKEANVYQEQLRDYQKAVDYLEQDSYIQAYQLFERVKEVEHGSKKLNILALQKISELEDMEDFEKVLIESGMYDDLFPNVEIDPNQEDKTLWDSGKSEMLNQFMNAWGDEVDVKYQSYNPQDNVSFYDLKLPKDILSQEWKMVIDDKAVPIEWSLTGEGELPHRLLAVYSDADTQMSLNKKVYFFMLVDQKPKVYVTQQSQFNTNNYIYFMESQNSELHESFNSILNQ